MLLAAVLSSVTPGHFTTVVASSLLLVRFTSVELAPVDGGTRFDYRNVFTAPLGPLGRVASRALVGGLPRREATASLRKLKKLAERG